MKKLVSLVLALVLFCTSTVAFAVEQLGSTATTPNGYVRFPASQSGHINGLKYGELANSGIDKSQSWGYLAGNGASKEGQILRKAGWKVVTLDEATARMSTGYTEEEARLEIVNAELLAAVLGDKYDIATLTPDDVADATLVGAPHEGQFKVAARIAENDPTPDQLVAKLHLTRWNDYIAVYALDWEHNDTIKLVLDAGYKKESGGKREPTPTDPPSNTQAPETQAPANPNPEYDNVVLPPSISDNTSSGGSGSSSDNGSGSGSDSGAGTSDSAIPDPEYDNVTLPWG